MKKRNVIVGILLVVLLFVFAPSAHAGVGNTDSGGSSLIDSGGVSSWSDGGSSWSDGGSSWSGGSSSYSSGSGTDSGGAVAVVAIIGLDLSIILQKKLMIVKNHSLQIVVQNGQPKSGPVDQLKITMKRFAASVNWIQCLMKTASCRKSSWFIFNCSLLGQKKIGIPCGT